MSRLNFTLQPVEGAGIETTSFISALYSPSTVLVQPLPLYSRTVFLKAGFATLLKKVAFLFSPFCTLFLLSESFRTVA